MFLISSIVVSIATALFELWRGGAFVVIVSYGVVVPLILVISRALERKVRLKEKIGKRRIKRISFYVFLTVFFNAVGSLFFYDIGPLQYDRFIHFTMGMLAALIVSVIFFHFFKTRSKAVLVAFVLLFIGTFAWEGLQFSVDKVFGTKTFGDSVQPIEVDVRDDIVLGVAGVTLGLLYSSKRIPRSRGVL